MPLVPQNFGCTLPPPAGGRYRPVAETHNLLVQFIPGRSRGLLRSPSRWSEGLWGGDGRDPLPPDLREQEPRWLGMPRQKKKGAREDALLRCAPSML